MEHILHASFDMATAVAGSRAAGVAKAAVKKGAVVLAEADHLQGMDALAYA